MSSDRTPADPSDDWTVPDLLAAIESAMSDGEYDTAYLLVPAARLLRRQGEQLDTLRNEVLRHRRMVEGCELVHPLPTLIEQVNGDLWAAAGGGVPEEGATDE